MTQAGRGDRSGDERSRAGARALVEISTRILDGLEVDDRGAVRLADVSLTFVVLVALLALAPVFATFIGMVSAEADPFSSLLLQLVIPLLFIFLLFSVGRSAQRGG